MILCLHYCTVLWSNHSDDRLHTTNQLCSLSLRPAVCSLMLCETQSHVVGFLTGWWERSIAAWLFFIKTEIVYFAVTHNMWSVILKRVWCFTTSNCKLPNQPTNLWACQFKALVGFLKRSSARYLSMVNILSIVDCSHHGSRRMCRKQSNVLVWRASQQQTF